MLQSPVISVFPIGALQTRASTNDGQRFPRQHHFLALLGDFSLLSSLYAARTCEKKPSAAAPAETRSINPAHTKADST